MNNWNFLVEQKECPRGHDGRVAHSVRHLTHRVIAGYRVCLSLELVR